MDTSSADYGAREIKTYEAFCTERHFWCLDGLRCVSILAVIWHHAAGDAYDAGSLLFAGHHGVTLFFVISGFLITSLLIREKWNTGSIALGHFYVRRALRIFPLYYGVLFLYCVLVFILERETPAGQQFFSNLLYFATYTANYFVSLGGDRVIFYFAWSLAVEEQFYLFWPTIERWLESSWAAFVAVFLIIMVMLANSDYMQYDQSLVGFLIGHLSIPICMGVLLAHALHIRAIFIFLAQVCAFPGVAWVSLVMPLSLLLLPDAPQELFYLSLTWMLCTLLLVEKHPLRGILTTRLFVNIGAVSYGLYLFHMLALNAVRKLLPNPEQFASLYSYQLLCFLLAAALGFVIAYLSFHVFEKPFLNLKKQWRADSNNNVKRPVLCVG